MDEARKQHDGIKKLYEQGCGDMGMCLNCKECLKTKCDIYKFDELKKAWNKLQSKITKHLRKLLDKIAQLLDKTGWWLID